MRDSAKPIAPHLQIAEEDDDETITEKLKLQGVRLGKGMVSPRVFWPALIVILAVAVVGIAAPESTSDVLVDMQSWIVTNFGWYYMLAIGFFIAFTAFVGFSKYGTIRLGRDGEDPEFGLLSWFAMLFAAGMGIGLVFYGVGEPLTYATSDPKPGWEGSETEKAQLAMAQTFLHWGLHPWAVYAVIGLALAYAIHRRGRPISIRWALEPLFGDRVKGWLGDLGAVLAQAIFEQPLGVVGVASGTLLLVGEGGELAALDDRVAVLVPRGQQRCRAVADDGDGLARCEGVGDELAGRGVDREVLHRAVTAGVEDGVVVVECDVGQVERLLERVDGVELGPHVVAVVHLGGEARLVRDGCDAAGRRELDGVTGLGEEAVRGEQLLGPESGGVLRAVRERPVRGCADDEENLRHVELLVRGRGSQEPTGNEPHMFRRTRGQLMHFGARDAL